MRKRISEMACALSVLLCAGFAYAQTVPATKPASASDLPPPPADETVPGTAQPRILEGPAELRPFEMQPSGGHFLGDWFGARTAIENFGVTPILSLETNAAWNPTGGKRQSITEASNLGLNLLFDLNKLASVKGGSFLLQFSDRWGSSLSRNDIGNLFDTQQVFGGETFRLVDAAYQQTFLDDRVEFRVGRISANDDFQVSVYDYLFMQNGFDGNPVGIYFNAPGMTAYPNATWGALAKVRPTKRTYVMAAIYNGDPSIRNNNRHGADLSWNGPTYVMGEGGLLVNGLPGDSEYLGNYKAGFWYDGSTQQEFGTNRLQTGSSGVYGLFDQIVLPFGDRNSNRGLGVFGSSTFSTDPSVGRMPYFFTGGVEARGLLASRPTDLCGLGFLYGSLSSDLTEFEQREKLVDPGTVVQDYEFVMELTYRLYFHNDSVFFQPDLQYINHPGGAGRVDDALVLGAQMGINF
jgi:porin